ncbi:CocE/NonD family hydrolase [Ferruginibacter sp. HRS2-29]|uniref:CocE/NonD family hydrolase n=1 Tax=Ferruginibacter sp. HRS2-29 TaxID=2487334 RepID=UPI0020CD5B1B|nr:CocE/NonD family hydrolase [Ferruginibacter sp. HRS2-29]MCP9751121.1 CocE/NonD family hydrolase [Ferruginibacter sp. HRS2-29]
MKTIFCTIAALLGVCATAQQNPNTVKENYTKKDTLISMRDGTRLYTVIYTPKDVSQKYPILMERTPYSAGPYGDTSYPRRIGPNPTLMNEKYIFVYQDVRGRYMSEGTNLEMTPYIPNKKSKKEVDESSDTYDTIDWLLKNIKNNNGRVGLYGISYPGFYATASLPGAHPAIRAVSPQAPVTDEFIGDDANHNGAFFLMDNFDFMNYFGKPRKGPVKDYDSQIFDINSKDDYDFFLQLGPVSNSQSAKYFNHKSYIWDEYLQHDTYDEYWKARNIRTHLKDITIPTLVVGGWFDAEDLFGALNTYASIETQSPKNNNRLVMGPWTHGAWESPDWKQYASHDFGSNTSRYFQDSVEAVFFNYYLKDEGTLNIAEATVFETGSNEWRSYNTWPPANVKNVPYYLSAGNQLSLSATDTRSFDEYTSDPNKPVPYTNGIFSRRNNDYMAEDQRFAAIRPDVLVYETGALTEDVTLSGKIIADLQVSMTGTDADFVVKLIDVLPENEPNFKNAPRGFQMAGYQRMVRAEVMRGKFRNSFEKPEAFVPGQVSHVKFALNDVAHKFKKGHKIMIQVQSSWFPLTDRNPQKFMRIPDAKESDFTKEDIRVYHTSKIILPVLP